MKGADLFNAEVLDPEGRRVGMVIDIRAVPVSEGRPALVVRGLVIGLRHVQLFGYQRRDEVGPKLFTRISALLHRDTRYAPLADVELSAPGTVRLRVPWDELDLLADV
ncbi:MAG TPA: hypothetical protein VKZ65_06225 [Glycomyces sp.]|nr:hypothetical protein [Glycomyces sp.]